MAGTANAVNGPEAAPYLAKAGGTMTGALTLNSSSPASDLIAASKGYVDSVAQGRVYKDPCVAASTAALTATYANGSGGVGATLTNAGAMAAFSLDGVSGAVGERFLIKDQASTLENGIYTLTTVGSGAANWVLTRATDMDQPAEFKYGTTFITSGTVNIGRTYTETATVATVGTDAVTFVLSGDAQQTLTVAQQIFTSNGTFTPTVGMSYCVVEVVGGGGSGAGAEGLAGESSAGGGGAGGGYSKGVFTLAQIIGAGSAASVTVGAGGSAPAAGSNPGNAGGTSTVVANSGAGATLIQATGGAGGNINTSSASVGQGNDSLGGIGSLGSLNVRGGSGRTGLTLSGVGTIFTPGAGGNSVYGGGAPGSGTNAAGTTGGVYGGGGSGGGSSNASGAVSGGAGAAGVVYITEYIIT